MTRSPAAADSRPHLLDLFSGAGGAARGYQLAGFRVTGVDIVPQPRYIGEAFVQADALEYLRDHGRDYEAIHASPPCQFYSVMRNLPWLQDKEYPALIEPVRELLNATGLPWVIENVMGAKLPAGWLCGTMFGKRFYRHRAFETNWFWLQPAHPTHPRAAVNHGGRFLGPRARRIVFQGAASGSANRWQSSAIAVNGAGVGVGHAAGFREARAEMGCEWMTRDEMGQAIPPCYTELIGRQLRAYLGG